MKKNKRNAKLLLALAIALFVLSLIFVNVALNKDTFKVNHKSLNEGLVRVNVVGVNGNQFPRDSSVISGTGQVIVNVVGKH